MRKPLVSLIFAATLATPVSASAQEHVKRHALSLLGETKYKAGFAHYDYVNATAPKGGRVRMAAIGTFDSLNALLYRGNAATGLGLIYDNLMEHTLDEASTAYCTLCEWVSHPEDFSSVTFKLRAGAKWHDGKAITAEDVIFSLESMKTVNPRMGLYYKNVVRSEAPAPDLVTIHFDMKGNRELPMIVGELLVLPKHYWTGTDKDGNKRDITKTTLEPPLGSGPYRIKEVVPGRTIAYERVQDYWGRELPSLRGINNFDEVRFEYFKDTTPALEAFKAGQLDFYQETSAKSWATQYDFAAVKDGRVKKREITVSRVNGMQAYVLNQRRAVFADRRVREAMALVFDFEWANANLFYGQYRRLNSYFANSELASRGLPEGRELEILQSVRGKVPDDVFTKPFANPVNAKPQDIRDNLRAAAKLLAEAGWQNKAGGVSNAAGERMAVEILLESPAFERIALPYAQALERIGVKATVRLVDAAQYKRRIDTFDYDIIVHTFAQSESPGNEQRDYWSSAAADQQGSRNLTGIKNAGVDALVERLIAASSRDDLIAATRALDRVLLTLHLVVPHWYSAADRVAHWDYFGEPKTLPSRSVGFPTVWWWDEARANKIAGAR